MRELRSAHAASVRSRLLPYLRLGESPIATIQNEELEFAGNPTREPETTSDFELSRFVSPELWAIIKNGVMEPVFLAAVISHISGKLAGRRIDVYLSRDPNEPRADQVIKVDSCIEDFDARLEMWREFVEFADELWKRIRFNVPGSPRVCPFVLIVW